MKRLFNGLCLLLLLMSLGLCDATAQSMVTVRGVVTSAEDSQPVIGATIVAGPTKGTTTSYDGTYSIVVEQGTKLSYQYLGYATVEWVTPTGISEVTHDVTLESD